METYFAKKEGKPLPVLPPLVPPAPAERDPDSPNVLEAATVAENRAPSTPVSP
jgi:hypothetical protein